MVASNESFIDWKLPAIRSSKEVQDWPARVPARVKSSMTMSATVSNDAVDDRVGELP